MTEQGWHAFVVHMENINLLTDTGDFFALVGGAVPYRVVEAKLWQRGGTAVVTDTVRYRRGTGATGGSALTTESKYGTAGPTPVCQALSLPTTDVTSDWEFRDGWNLLQAVHWLPTPRFGLPMKANDDFAIARDGIVAHTGVGCTVVWEEYIGS